MELFHILLIKILSRGENVSFFPWHWQVNQLRTKVLRDGEALSEPVETKNPPQETGTIQEHEVQKITDEPDKKLSQAQDQGNRPRTRAGAREASNRDTRAGFCRGDG